MDKRKYIVVTVLVSALFVILLAAFVYTSWLDLPQTYEKQISELANRGEMERALDKYDEMRKVLAEGLDRETRSSCEYILACGMYSSARYEEAQLLFNSLGDFRDSENKLKECIYELAVLDYNEGRFSEAADVFRSLGVFSDSQNRLKDCHAAIAEQLYQAGELSEAISAFRDLGDYPGAAERAYEIALEITGDKRRAEEMVSNELSQEEQEQLIVLEMARQNLAVGKIAAGRSHSVALRSDGTVIATGCNDHGQCDVESWTDVVAVCAGADFTLGLRSDGTVLAAGSNEFGQCDVGGWSNIKSIAANDYNSFGVTHSGSLVFSGYHDYTDSLAGGNISEVYAGAYQGACILADGTVISSNSSSAINGKPASVALTTALAVSLNWDGTIDSRFDRIPKWEDIIAIALNSRGLLGLTSEGEVNSFFFRESDVVDINAEDASIVAISAGGGHYLLLDSEGRVHAFGDNSSGQCNTQDWQLWD